MDKQWQGVSLEFTSPNWGFVTAITAATEGLAAGCPIFYLLAHKQNKKKAERDRTQGGRGADILTFQRKDSFQNQSEFCLSLPTT